MSNLKATDIATVPPVDRKGEMKTAAQLLARWRKQLVESGLPAEWQLWVADCLKAGVENDDAEPA